MTLTLSILALLIGAAALAHWARFLAAWESDLTAREAALESARVARQEQLVAIAAERMELERVRSGGGAGGVPDAEGEGVMTDIAPDLARAAWVYALRLDWRPSTRGMLLEIARELWVEAVAAGRRGARA